MKKTIMALLVTALMITALCTACAESGKPSGIILITEYQQMGWAETFEFGALDAAGNLWLYTSDSREDIPYDAEGLLKWAESSEALEQVGSITAETLSDIISMVDTVEVQEVKYAAVADDAGTQTSYAVCRNREIVVLGASGDEVYENTDPAAQALYRFLRRNFKQIHDFDGEEGMAPTGFVATDILTFCEYDDMDLTALEMTAFYNDCEEGAQETEPQLTVDQIAGMKVIGKKNSMFTTGNTITYVFRDADGKTAAAFEFYGNLLVGKDGMYSVE